MNSVEQWGRSPKFHLRLDGTRALSRGWAPGHVFQVGAGTGEMAQEFLRLGHHASLYDLGAQTRSLLRRRYDRNSAVEIVDSVEAVADASVDYLLAFEVLEHISDDAAALRSWTAKLRPGGRLLVSVPAHQRKFSATDLRVGHVIRYERQELHGLIESAGYEAIQIACYGFPLGNLGRIIGNLLEPRISVDDRADAVGRSIRSGTQQSGGVLALGRLLRPWMLWPFFLLQRLTFRFDFGDGYIATAQRRI